MSVGGSEHGAETTREFEKVKKKKRSKLGCPLSLLLLLRAVVLRCDDASWATMSGVVARPVSLGSHDVHIRLD